MVLINLLSFMKKQIENIEILDVSLLYLFKIIKS